MEIKTNKLAHTPTPPKKMNNLSSDESAFLSEHPQFVAHIMTEFGALLSKEKKTKIILCQNSRERKLVHLLANAHKLYHARFGEWNEHHYKHFDWQCSCKYCWKESGEQNYRIVGVKVSTEPLPLTKKDRSHQKKNLAINICNLFLFVTF